MTGVLIRVGSGVILAAAASLALLTWVSSNRAIHPGTEEYPWSLRDYPELRPQEVNVPSSTGVNIAGRFFPGRRPETVVLSHGYGGSQDEMLPVAAFLHSAGLNVFTYDLRGSGRSQGTVTFGTLEQKDLISMVDYLQRRPEVDKDRIGAFGFSMGAAVTLLAAAEDTRIKAVVSDSAWSDVHHWLRPSLGQVLTHPIAPFSTLSIKLTEWRTGADLGSLRPVDQVARVGPRPLLLIHGTSDATVPPADSDELFAAAREPKELWQQDGAGHGDTMQLPDYRDRVTAFFLGAFERPASTRSAGSEGK
ncbi:MAG: alpha/beta hydrolase [Frankiaceae bacterium]